MAAKIATSQEDLKIKVAERKSKKAILASYADSVKGASAESTIVTQGAIDDMTKGIADLKKTLKKDI